MPLPTPEPGLVIHYEYLWRNEHQAGEEEGSKRRPCAVIIAIESEIGKRVVVAPITHLAPQLPSEGIEIPPRVKKFLGLDDQKSWVVVTDLNEFIWPGVDIYSVPGKPLEFEYGHLPPKLYETIKERIDAISTAPTPRSESR